MANTMATEPFFVDPAGYRKEIVSDLLEGFSRPQKSIPGKYLWDEVGSQLFDQICSSGDYYPTSCETDLLQRAATTIAETVGSNVSLVEYGSGASHKVRILLDAFEHPRRYLAIDISGSFLRDACRRIADDYPGLDVTPVCADYTRDIFLPALSPPQSVLGFFPGTTIGNFDQANAVRFLSRARQTLGPSWFLVGVDPNSDPSTLSRAYAGCDGLMAAFHKNILARIARDADAGIPIDDFYHEARVLSDPLRVEAHLVARRSAEYQFAGHGVSFVKGESIHTDTSYKYNANTFRELARLAGWDPVRCWMDDRRLFSLHLLRG